MFIIGILKSLIGTVLPGSIGKIMNVIVIIMVLVAAWFAYSSSQKIMTFFGFNTKANLETQVDNLKTTKAVLGTINTSLAKEIENNSKSNKATITAMVKSRNIEVNDQKKRKEIRSSRVKKLQKITGTVEIIVPNAKLVVPNGKTRGEVTKFKKGSVTYIVLIKKKVDAISKINMNSIWSTYNNNTLGG